MKISAIQKFIIIIVVIFSSLFIFNIVKADLIAPVTPYQDWKSSYDNPRTKEDKSKDIIIGGLIVGVTSIISVLVLIKIKNKNVP